MSLNPNPRVLREFFQHTAYSTNAYVDEGRGAAGVVAG